MLTLGDKQRLQVGVQAVVTVYFSAQPAMPFSVMRLKLMAADEGYLNQELLNERDADSVIVETLDAMVRQFGDEGSEPRLKRVDPIGPAARWQWL